MRHRILPLVLALAMAVDGTASAQVASGGAGGSVRIRMRSSSDSATRAKRERLLLRFDSLRYAFENERMSDAERERLATEMHGTVMALQESLDGATFARAADAEREAMAMAGPMTFAWQGYASRGYLGVSFDGPSVEEVRRGGERIIRFLDYPRIALVEPSSPAERAGILQGDTLLAFNGDDVRDKQISLTKLLVPDQRVIVRVRRDGNARDFRVRIEEAPGYVMSRRTPLAPVAMPAGTPMPPAPAITPTPVRVYSGEDFPRRAPMAAVAMGGGQAPAATSVWVMTDGVGGAKVETINEGLAKTIGVRAGVLVLRVNPGTPAYRSGLRDGDVILRASGRQVNSVRELRSLVENDDENSGVKLVIQRERRQREVVLRW